MPIQWSKCNKKALQIHAIVLDTTRNYIPQNSPFVMLRNSNEILKRFNRAGVVYSAYR